MKISDLILLAFQNLYGNKMRSLLTILGVGVGIGAIIFLVGLGFGLQRLTVSRLTTSSTITTLDVSSANPDLLKIDGKVLDRIKNLPEVEKVASVINLPGQVTFNETTTETLVRGVDNNFYQLNHYKFLAGQPVLKKNQAVVSSGLLKLYKVEDPNQVLGKNFKVTVFALDSSALAPSAEQDVSEAEVQISGVFDNPLQLIEINSADQEMFQQADYSRVKVKVKELNQVETVGQQITNWGFNVSSLLDKIKEINRVFRVIQFVLAGFGLIALIVASIGMFNTMTVTLLERTREIGVMRALGARRSDVRRLFIFEAGIIGFLGGVAGIALAWILILGVNFGVNILASRAGQSAVVIYYLPWFFLGGILIFSFLVGLSTGVYPAVRASRLNPLDALRYE